MSTIIEKGGSIVTLALFGGLIIGGIILLKNLGILDLFKPASATSTGSTQQSFSGQQSDTEAQRTRAEAELARAQAEQDRLLSEADRADSEGKRAEAEFLRAQAELERANSEKARDFTERLKNEILGNLAQQGNKDAIDALTDTNSAKQTATSETTKTVIDEKTKQEIKDKTIINPKDTKSPLLQKTGFVELIRTIGTKKGQTIKVSPDNVERFLRRGGFEIKGSEQKINTSTPNKNAVQAISASKSNPKSFSLESAFNFITDSFSIPAQGLGKLGIEIDKALKEPIPQASGEKSTDRQISQAQRLEQEKTLTRDFPELTANTSLSGAKKTTGQQFTKKSEKAKQIQKIEAIRATIISNKLFGKTGNPNFPITQEEADRGKIGIVIKR